MSLLFTVLSFIVAIGVLVTVHEFGHFWVARKLGVKVLRFSSTKRSVFVYTSPTSSRVSSSGLVFFAMGLSFSVNFTSKDGQK